MTEDKGEKHRRVDNGGIAVSASLITQGTNTFYMATMDNDLLAASCTVDTRINNPLEGFQRLLDEKRADDIAKYIDRGGTIPTSIVLSAQPEAELSYSRARRSLSFKITPRSFLILDGQHRVFGYAKAKARKVRVPVVVYNGLTRAQEAQLFIDINTKQRPVPSALLLDIKRLAERETGEESLMRDIFDFFSSEAESPLIGRMSPSSTARGKLSRHTFNAALKPIRDQIGVDAAQAYATIAAYLRAWIRILREMEGDNLIANATLFKAIILLFPEIAQRVSDKFSGEFSANNFNEILEPFFRRLKKNDVMHPGSNVAALHETFQKRLRSGFSIARPL